MDFSQFFFLRPWWLLMLIPAAGLVVLAFRMRSNGDASAWRKLVDPHLLAVLAVKDGASRRSRWLPAALAAGLAAATVAMAGPTWEKIELPTFKSKEPAVVVLSLAQSMNADDVKPSRLTRAEHKLRDTINRMDGGDIGLVIYSDRPFVAAPLTGDGDVIRQMLPELSTALMPVLGNRPDRAIAQASDLLTQAGASSGRIILLADNAGSDPDATDRAARAAAGFGYTVDVLGIGTDEGAALQTADGRAIASQDGTALQARYDEAGLARIATAGNGVFAGLTAGSADLDRILPESTAIAESGGRLQDDFKADGWADMGFWLLLVPVLLAPFAFRRNVLMIVPFAAAGLALSTPQPANAAGIRDYLLTPDQQAAEAFGKQDYASAAATFEDPAWRASAQYRAGDFQAAAAGFAGTGDPESGFNRGNALAKSGELQSALEAYDTFLERHPDDADAQFNRDLVAKLLEQQQQQQDQQQQSGDSQQDQQQQQQAGDQQDQQQQQQAGGQQDQQQQQQAGDQQDQQQQQQAGDQQDQQQQQQAGEQQDQQQQQQAGDQQDQQQQQQAGDQQDQQQQQQAGDQQDQQQQQQAGDQQDQQQQQQAGDQQDQQQQQQAGDQQDQQQQQQAGDQQDQQQQQQAGGQQDQQQQQAQSGDTRDDRSAFRKAMDELLNGNGGHPGEPTNETPTEQAASPGYSEKDQANEQLLRSVPDDPSGLLRARIRQYYATLQ